MTESDVDMVVEDEDEDELILKPHRRTNEIRLRQAGTLRGVKGKLAEDDGEEEEEEEDEQEDEEVEGEGEGDDSDNDDGDEDEDEEEDDDDDDDGVRDNDAHDGGPSLVDVSHTPSPVPQRPRLKIKLRLPVHASSSSNTASTPARTVTPAHDDASRSSSRRDRSAGLDIESEDENDLIGDKDHSRRSGRPMTARQAVLASVVDSTHVSLSGKSRKKKPLNDAELALRREETARKRRNLTEKKLEDEKAETINRLLKKQSRPKKGRNALYHADDRTPHSSSLPPTNTNTRAPSTPVPQSLHRETTAPTDSNADGDENAMQLDVSVAPVLPVMYRWISTSRVGPGAGKAAAEEKRMSLTFSVPVSVTGTAEAALGMVLPEGEGKIPPVPPTRREARCDVEGCTELRKYRLVKDWTKGACGMSHLRQLDVR